ncbi:ETC complex I subunit [Halocynthiibacter namhaensis]|uniref:ETC complex I subunit n=1 Tax=Halocynthiibacter namhaensis TaxID=1290553 RepID=UPI0005795B60|nr:ETC complex I subunit [Halocynthiibacter namhaensis]
MRARLFKPARNAMQSGTAKTKNWVLEFAPASAREVDPLMGWTSSDDTQSQVRMSFESKDAALDYAKSSGVDVTVQDPKTRKPVIRPNGYGENFATHRRTVWTH